MRPLRSLSVLLLTLCALVGVGVTPASAEDVSWAVRTASNDFGRGRENFRYVADPGTTVKDAFVVVNHGRKPITLQLYAADGFTTEAGQLDLTQQKDEQRGVGAWMHVSRSSVTVKGRSKVSVPFTVEPPKNATPGDHMGGIVTSLAQDEQSAGLTVDRRLAIRVRLRVSGDLRPTLAVENVAVDYAGTANPAGRGDATVTWTVHNTGNAILTARQAASVAGPFGAFRVKAEKVRETPELLPGESWKAEAVVHDVVPALRLGAQVDVTPIVTDASGTTSALPAVRATGHGWALPWATLLLLLVLVAAGVLAWRARGRSRAKQKAAVDAAVAAALRDRETVDS